VHRAAARAISIAGHPVVVMFAAGMVSASRRGTDVEALRSTAAVLAALGAMVVLFGWRQVRTGRWGHVDASARTERTSLNVFLAGALLASAAVAALLVDARHLAVALAIAAVPILAALLLARWVKASLHTAFAAFATALLWPWVTAVVVGAGVTVAVAWSRLVLGRHQMRDVIAGLLLGLAAGAAYIAWDS
jgi:membrane-associated phospholipid phosphatase